jgi:uncharacterized protein
MAGKFVLKRSSNGKFYFNLLAGNNEIIATSEMYESKAAAHKGIESVRHNATDAMLDDRSEAPVPKPAKPAQPKAAPAQASAAQAP